MTMSARVLTAPTAAAVRATPTVGARTLALVLIALFALDNLLLPAFLGAPVALMLFVAVPAAAAFGWLLTRAGGLSARVPISHLAFAFAIALMILALGGEGRLFYANPDWQIRDAVLFDLASNPWPYAYDLNGWTAILRAPLGLYLLPSLGGRDLTDAALLISTSARLAILLALAAQLFHGRRQQLIALAVFLVFSGMDVIGNWMTGLFAGPVPWDHLEQWNPGSQYSSTITLAFWVPNHALAGWTCAVAYLLWMRRLAPIGLLGAAIPLVALWSPLAVIGALPFALHAAARALRENEWSKFDAGLTALGVVLAAPSLWFLRLDASAVGGGWWPLALVPLILLLAFEVAPLLVPLFHFKRLREGERVTLWLVFLCLLFMPMFRIGVSIDFQMRASIVPLALLTFSFAEWIADLLEPGSADPSRPDPSPAPTMLALPLLILAVGAATPFMEIRRAVINRPSPAPLCSLGGAWRAQSNAVAPYATYFADVAELPSWLPKAPITAGRSDPARCWSRPWVPINQR